MPNQQTTKNPLSNELRSGFECLVELLKLSQLPSRSIHNFQPLYGVKRAVILCSYYALSDRLNSISPRNGCFTQITLEKAAS